MPQVNTKISKRHYVMEEARSGNNGSNTRGLRWASLSHLVVIFLGTVAVAYFARAVVIPVVLAVIISTTLRLPTNWLCRRRLPPPLATVVVMVIVGCATVFLAIRLGQPAIEWGKSAPEHLSQLKSKLGDLIGPFRRMTKGATSADAGDMSGNVPRKNALSLEGQANQIAGTVFTWTWSTVAGSVEMVVLVFMLLASSGGFVQKVVNVLPREQDKKKAFEISREIQQSVSSYLFTVTHRNQHRWSNSWQRSSAPE